MKPIVLIGDGGHAKVIKDIIYSSKDYKIIAVLDDKYQENIEKEKILYGRLENYKNLIAQYNPDFFIALGDGAVRMKIVKKLEEEHVNFATIIHPNAVCSPSSAIGTGTVIMANAVIQTDAVIGSHTIINTASVVEHDCIINDFAHISPGAVLTGGVEIGTGTHIGAGAVVIPNKQVGSWSVVGAGATVTHSLASDVVAVGVPASYIKKTKKGGI